MRLDHLLSREYIILAIDHESPGLGCYCGKFCFVLYSFEGAAMYFQKGKWTKAGHRGGVAQLVEHLLCKQGVIGSNPFISTIEKW